MTRRYLTRKRLRTPALGVHQYTYQYQVTVFYSRCEHCTQYLQKEKLLYFCNIFVIMYCTIAVEVHTVHSCPSSAKELVDFLLFYFSFGCLLYSMITAACLTALISKEFMRKKIGSFFFQPKLLE